MLVRGVPNGILKPYDLPDFPLRELPVRFKEPRMQPAEQLLGELALRALGQLGIVGTPFYMVDASEHTTHNLRAERLLRSLIEELRKMSQG